MNQLNPSITSPRMGDRARASRVSPRNITGRRYAELHAEQEAKRAAASIDISEIQLRAREEGFSQGFDAAIAWVTTRMIDAGLDPDILVAADDETEHGAE
jgi:uncharacterized protein related to proFAR isomerase